jgi:hypothetical protein
MNIRKYLASFLVASVVISGVNAVTDGTKSRVEEVFKKYQREMIGTAIGAGVTIPVTAVAAWFIKGYCTEKDVAKIVANEVAKKAAYFNKLAEVKDRTKAKKLLEKLEGEKKVLQEAYDTLTDESKKASKQKEIDAKDEEIVDARISVEITDENARDYVEKFVVERKAAINTAMQKALGKLEGKEESTEEITEEVMAEE